MKIRKIFFGFDYHFVLHYLGVRIAAADQTSTSYLRIPRRFKHMASTLKFIAALSVWFIMVSVALGSDSMPPAENGVLPEIVLKVPESPELQQYLGLTGKKTFKIPDIKSEIVIIEIFSMY